MKLKTQAPLGAGKTIERTGRVAFGDARISITEEGLNNRMSWDERKAWEAQFKRDVFTRVVQTLNRLGWACAVPPKEEKQNSASFALNFRNCSKGDLKGELEITGRCIAFEMWQDVNTPTRPDYGGRYESDLEGCMPYVLRLEMERTRRRIRDYLCSVFTGYEFDPRRYTSHHKPLTKTAMERIQQQYAESWHFKGDLTNYEISDYNRKSADGALLEHGQRVWFADWHGRICTGTAFYNINNMWWVVTGKYDYTNMADFELYVKCPDHPRAKRNSKLRRQRLEQELNKAVKCMDFKRAQVLKDVLFPAGPLYAIWHKEHALFFAANYSGYRNSIADAGKYTLAELKPYLKGALETESFKAIPIGN